MKIMLVMMWYVMKLFVCVWFGKGMIWLFWFRLMCMNRLIGFGNLGGFSFCFWIMVEIDLM